MIRNPENDKLLGVLFTLKDGSTKFVKNMTIDQDKEDLDRAIELLKRVTINLQEETCRDWAEIEGDIYKFLKEIKENDSRNAEK